IGKVPPLRYYLDKFIANPKKSNMYWTLTNACNFDAGCAIFKLQANTSFKWDSKKPTFLLSRSFKAGGKVKRYEERLHASHNTAFGGEKPLQRGGSGCG
ncbi:MAG: hypothetical protein JW954_02935, partial [Dehalococcoidaceae bacterium]|nr:hypothetical protein [Dehalococcoidaceae bacterium]